MQFTGKLYRNFWLAIAFGAACDLALSYVLVYLFSDQVEILAVAGVFAAIQAASALLALRAGAWVWLWFLWRGRDTGADALARALDDRGFPRPDFSYDSPSGYFANIIDDEDAAIHLRLRASAELAAFQQASSAGMNASLRTAIVYERALERLRDVTRSSPPLSQNGRG